MPLPVFDTQDAVPEAFREEYEEREGKWHPKAETELATEKRRRAELLSEKKESDRLRKEAEEKVAAAERTAEARARGISEDALADLREKEKAARKPLEDRIAELEGINRQLTLTDRVKALALTAGVMPDRIKQAMKILDERTDLGNAGGIVVKNEDGSISSETVEDFLGKTFKKESPWFYAGSGASGSGASGSNGSGGTTTDTTTQAQALERKRQTMPGSV